MLRRILLSLALLVSLVAPAIAQPAPVPALPDTERRTAYTISGTTCACAINFALYGDGTDYGNWLDVWLNGVNVLNTDPTFGWTVTSPSGPLGNLARPITDAVLTFNNAQTGTVQIVGARRPRQTSQFNESRGVTARDLNVRLTDLTAVERELWDKTNDMTGRGLFFAPGNTTGPMPQPSNCHGSYLGFDGTGLNPVCIAPTQGTGNVVGAGPSVIGNAPVFSNATGNAIIDSGVSLASTTGNLVLATPNGGPGIPALRTLLAPDLPATIAYQNGNNTFTGTNTFSGNNTFSGTNNFGGLVEHTGPTPVQFFVATGGNDSNDCLTAPTACLTVQGAVNTAMKYDANNNNARINIGAGTFTGPIVVTGSPRGTLRTISPFTALWFIGSGSATTTLDDTSAACGTLVTSQSGTNVILQNLTIQKTSGCSNGGSAIFAQANSYVALGVDVAFGVAGTAGGQHLHAETNSVIELTADYKITGNAGSHMGVVQGGRIVLDGHVVTCTGGVTAFTAFAQSQVGASIYFLTGSSFSGCGSITGLRYVVDSNATVNVPTGSINSFLPGNASGQLSNGGLYIPQPVPALGACTNGTINTNASDQRMSIAFTGVNTTCAVTFANTKGQAPVCVASSTSATTVRVTTGTTAISLTGSFANTDVVDVICLPQPN